MAQKKVLSTDDLEATPTEDLATKTATSEYLFDWRALYNTHVAGLDAHTRNMLQTFRTGQYLPNILLNRYTYGASTLVADTLYATPFLVVRTLTVDKLVIRCHATDAGQFVRLGIYEDGTNLYPGDLLVDAGTAELTPIGQKDITISGDQQLVSGIYWMALVSDSNAGQVTDRRIQIPILGAVSTDSRNNYSGWSVAQAYGALPDPFTAAGSAMTIDAWDIFPKLKTLD